MFKYLNNIHLHNLCIHLSLLYSLNSFRSIYYSINLNEEFCIINNGPLYIVDNQINDIQYSFKLN